MLKFITNYEILIYFFDQNFLIILKKNKYEILRMLL